MSTTLTRWSGQAAVERCDRCFARAKVRVVFPSGNDLLFCAHHAHKHRDGLAGLEVMPLLVGDGAA